MKVNIVTEGNRIKMRISEKIVKYNDSPVEYTISLAPRPDVDINFYVCFNVFAVFGSKSGTKDVGYVTHVHNDSISEHTKDLGVPFSVFDKLDAYLHMSSRTVKYFDAKKYNAVVYGGCEINKFKPTITLGIMQNGEVVGKGLKFLSDMLDVYDFRNFKFIFCGVGWESILEKMNKLGVRYESYENMEYSDFQHVYELIDYLFIPSLWEGGPMAVLEAMACGIPVISSDVGWVKEILPDCLCFQPGSKEELFSILEKIQFDKIKVPKNIEHFSYLYFTRELYNNFIKILNV